MSLKKYLEELPLRDKESQGAIERSAPSKKLLKKLKKATKLVKLK